MGNLRGILGSDLLQVLRGQKRVWSLGGCDGSMCQEDWSRSL